MLSCLIEHTRRVDDFSRQDIGPTTSLICTGKLGLKSLTPSVYAVFEKNPEFYARLIHEENLPVIEFAIRK